MRHILKNKARPLHARAGFTLPEILIVTVIMSVVSLAMYSTFNSGIKIWQRTSEYIVEEDLDIFFDKFATDLRNAARFGQGGFSCQENSFRFYTLAFSKDLGVKTVAEAAYYFDPGKEELAREERDFSQIFSGWEGRKKIMLKDLARFNFNYYAYDKQSKTYLWERDLPQDNPPLAVKVEFTLKNGDAKEKFSHTVSIPVNG